MLCAHLVLLLAPATADAAQAALSGVGFIRSRLLGQGEFGGLDILDIIVLVLLAAALVQLLRNGLRRGDQAPGGEPQAPADPAEQENLEARHARAREAWARLSGAPASAAPGPAGTATAAPGDFNEAEFLSGAKAAFARIQSSASRGDAADLAQFVAPEAVEQVLRQAGGPSAEAPEIVLLEAGLEDRREQGGRELVRVRYRALMRHGGEQAAPREHAALWRFSRQAGNAASHWMLEAVEE